MAVKDAQQVVVRTCTQLLLTFGKNPPSRSINTANMRQSREKKKKKDIYLYIFKFSGPWLSGECCRVSAALAFCAFVTSSGSESASSHFHFSTFHVDVIADVCNSVAVGHGFAFVCACVCVCRRAYACSVFFKAVCRPVCDNQQLTPGVLIHRGFW